MRSCHQKFLEQNSYSKMFIYEFLDTFLTTKFFSSTVFRKKLLCKLSSNVISCSPWTLNFRCASWSYHWNNLLKTTHSIFQKRRPSGSGRSHHHRFSSHLKHYIFMIPSHLFCSWHIVIIALKLDPSPLFPSTSFSSSSIHLRLSSSSYLLSEFFQSNTCQKSCSFTGLLLCVFWVERLLNTFDVLPKYDPRDFCKSFLFQINLEFWYQISECYSIFR